MTDDSIYSNTERVVSLDDGKLTPFRLQVAFRYFEYRTQLLNKSWDDVEAEIIEAARTKPERECQNLNTP